MKSPICLAFCLKYVIIESIVFILLYYSIMTVVEKLQQFYDAQAEKFVATRKKPRPEFEHILALFPKVTDKPLKVLEIGC